MREKALDDFARDNNIKPESIKKAYKRFQVNKYLKHPPSRVRTVTRPVPQNSV